MQLDGLIYIISNEVRALIIAFTLVLCVGFYTGIMFVDHTSKLAPSGIEERFLGNENNQNAKIYKFKKSKQEILTLVHNHVLSMAIIFFILGVILNITKLNKKLKFFLTVEPFLSILFTFGGLYLLWKGFIGFKYVIAFSGVLMTITFSISVLIILYQSIFYKKR